MHHPILLSKLKHLHILYIEDDHLVRKEIVEYLKRYFYLVEEACSAEDAMILFEKNKPHIILVDINLPKENGLSFVQNVRKKHHDVRIIIASAYSNKAFLLSAVELELTRYLVKPITGKTLLEALEKAADEYMLLTQKETLVDLGEGFMFYKQQRVLQQGNKNIILRPKEIQLLEYFIAHPKELISYAVLEYDVWKEESMSKDAIRSQIRNLRKKTHHKMIENINGIGYRLYHKDGQ